MYIYTEELYRHISGHDYFFGETRIKRSIVGTIMFYLDSMCRGTIFELMFRLHSILCACTEMEDDICQFSTDRRKKYDVVLLLQNCTARDMNEASDR